MSISFVGVTSLRSGDGRGRSGSVRRTRDRQDRRTRAAGDLAALFLIWACLMKGQLLWFKDGHGNPTEAVLRAGI